MSVPTKDSSLSTYAPGFATIVSGAPTTYGTTAAACTALTTASTAFVTAFGAQQQDGSKSKTLTAAKNSSKKSLLSLIRAMYTQIQANASVSDAQKVALGITVKKLPSPQPAPATEPVTSVISVTGRTVRIRLRDASNPHRVGRPVGCTSAAVLSYVGATPPSSITGWTLEGVVSKTVVDVTFPDTAAPGAQVWFTCYWLNRKSESGPASDPINTYLQLGAVTMVA